MQGSIYSTDEACTSGWVFGPAIVLFLLLRMCALDIVLLHPLLVTGDTCASRWVSSPNIVSVIKSHCSSLVFVMMLPRYVCCGLSHVVLSSGPEKLPLTPRTPESRYSEAQ